MRKLRKKMKSIFPSILSKSPKTKVSRSSSTSQTDPKAGSKKKKGTKKNQSALTSNQSGRRHTYLSDSMFLTDYMRESIVKTSSFTADCTVCPQKPKLFTENIYGHITENQVHRNHTKKLKEHEELVAAIKERKSRGKKNADAEESRQSAYSVILEARRMKLRKRMHKYPYLKESIFLLKLINIDTFRIQRIIHMLKYLYLITQY